VAVADPHPRIDEFLPNHDFSAAYEIRIDAPASAVYQCLLRSDFSELWLVRLLDRIEYFKRVLGDKSASRDYRIEALKFIVHFVGDIHQPLHAIGEAKGGNGVHVTEFGSDRCGRYPCNLHSAWDSGLIEHTGMDEEAYVAHLDQLISQEHLRASGNPADWANESFALAKAAWVNEGGSVDEQYYRQQIKAVDVRLALAGLRLAAVLNEVLGHASPQEFRH